MSSEGKISFGGLDPRYTPLALEVTVESYKRGVPLMAKGAVGEIATQDMCVLRHGKVCAEIFANASAPLRETEGSTAWNRRS